MIKNQILISVLLSTVVYFTLILNCNSVITTITSPSASVSAWSNRTIYQVLTDRFARSDGSTQACGNLQTYCGGSFDGMVNQLDYIQALGFDAIWISPVPRNSPNGYHGYWFIDLYTVNPHFGTSNDLLAFVQAAHERGIYVMLDVVMNHAGSFNGIPFNQSSHFHDCTNDCKSGTCNIEHWDDPNQVENCRLFGLADLNQNNNQYVASTLIQWTNDMLNFYGFDGLRLDTVPEVQTSFWSQFQSNVNVYKVGEVFNGDIGYVSNYQNYIDAVLNYPLYFALRNVFGSKQSMGNLESLNQQLPNSFRNWNVLGTFVDNHDNPRFLNLNSDWQSYKNALLYVLFSTGIPIIYYGSEQGFNGGADPNCREDLWRSNYNRNTQLFQFISTGVQARKKLQVWQYQQIQRYSTTNFYAFTRGNTFVAFTNGGSGTSVSYPITYHPYSEGTKLCSIFNPSSCWYVHNGQFTMNLNNGAPDVLIPSSQMEMLFLNDLDHNDHDHDNINDNVVNEDRVIINEQVVNGQVASA